MCVVLFIAFDPIYPSKYSVWTKSYRRRYGVITSRRRRYDVVLAFYLYAVYSRHIALGWRRIDVYMMFRRR